MSIFSYKLESCFRTAIGTNPDGPASILFLININYNEGVAEEVYLIPMERVGALIAVDFTYIGSSSPSRLLKIIIS
jgi:hypothetical protein